jgi:hypothetical protein
VSVILGCVALVVALLESTTLSVVVAGVAILAVIVGVHVLGGKEFSAIGTRILEGLRRRRRRRSAWVEVYNTAAKMDSALSVEEMWQDAGELFTRLDVDTVHVSLIDAPGSLRELDWKRATSAEAGAEAEKAGMPWTIRLPLTEDGRVTGELTLAKDTHRGPLPDALFEILDVLRREMLKTLERLSAGEGGGAPE